MRGGPVVPDIGKRRRTAETCQLADPSLIPDLECFVGPSDHPCLDTLVVEAHAACSANARPVDRE